MPHYGIPDDVYAELVTEPTPQELRDKLTQKIQDAQNAVQELRNQVDRLTQTEIPNGDHKVQHYMEALSSLNQNVPA